MRRLIYMACLVLGIIACKAQNEISLYPDYPVGTINGTHYFAIYAGSTNQWKLPFSRLDAVFQTANANLDDFAAISLSTDATTLINSASFAVMRTHLNLEPGVDIHPYTPNLNLWGAIAPSADMQTFLGNSTFADMRSGLGLAIGSNVQAHSSTLDIYAAIAPSSNVQTMLGSVNNNGIRSNIGLGTASTPEFSSLTLSGTPSLTTDAATVGWVQAQGYGSNQGIASVLQTDNNAQFETVSNISISAVGLNPSINMGINFGSSSLYWSNGYIDQIFTNYITGDGLIYVYQDLDIDNNNLENVGSIDVDNITINANAITTTNTNGDLNLDPSGTGNVDMNGANVVNAADYNGVALTISGSATNFLNEQGNYVAVSTGTDDQTIDELNLNGTTLEISLENDGQATQTVSLASLQDGTGTDDQTASEVNITDTEGDYTGTTAEAAFAEIADSIAVHRTEIDGISGGTAGTHIPVVSGTNLNLIYGFYPYYIQIGNYVKVDVHGEVRTSSTGATTITLTLPVATSNFVNDYDAAGIITTSTGIAGTVEATVAAQTITASFDSDTTSDQNIRISFTYEIQ